MRFVILTENTWQSAKKSLRQLWNKEKEWKILLKYHKIHNVSKIFCRIRYQHSFFRSSTLRGVNSKETWFFQENDFEKTVASNSWQIRENILSWLLYRAHIFWSCTLGVFWHVQLNIAKRKQIFQKNAFILNTRVTCLLSKMPLLCRWTQNRFFPDEKHLFQEKNQMFKNREASKP